MSIPRPEGGDINIGPSIMAEGWTLYTLCTFVVAARVFTQIKLTQNFGTGDIVMIGALVFGLLQLTMQTLAFTHGWGRHFFFLTDEQRVNAMEFVFVSEPMAIMCSTLGRVSFMYLMLRLFGNTKKRRWFLYGLMAQQLIVNLFTCITIFTQCGNVHSLWNPVGEPSKCWNPDVQTDTGYVQGVFNSATDLILTVMPISIFYTLQMDLRIKLGLAGLLGLSVFAFAASIVKTVMLKNLGVRADYTYNTVLFFRWVIVENTLVIVASSVPLLRPLFSAAKKATKTHYGSNSAYELGSRQNGSSAFAYAKSGSNSKSLQASSSEENILPAGGGVPLGTKERVQHFGSGREGDVDLEQGVIKKEVHYQVKYERDPSAPAGLSPESSKWDLDAKSTGGSK
ncbi:hypothetical protein NA56DRAFT_90841 [Hyaloscypha hepaticicola]|uniref:Rhodopsin domain-containing protein n=1 Tax=Hyaloscypha hepaticicola TaxID=2082293 RepID=A0A2J6Q8I0_9HELO|nr:hypothetical protein NA56DRAFT_90841 [Hyaloscypha hepaticicola]